ncbi:MAG: hypothetical protein ABEI96_10810 [Haloarculaceae archaeon]
MIPRTTLRENDRGASTVVTHAMTFTITAMLITGLLVGAGTLLDDQRKRAVRTQLTDLGGQMVRQLQAVDDLYRTDNDVATLTVRTDYPATVAGSSYTVALRHEDGDAYLHLTTTTPTLDLRFRVATRTSVVESRAAPESLTICLAAPRRLAISEGSC